MSKNSAQQNILNFLRERYPEVWASGELQRMEFKNKDGTNASPSVINRRCRNLEEEKLLAVRYENKNHAHYRHLQEWERENYIPTSQREEEYSNKCWKDPNIVRDNKYKIEQILDEETRTVKLVKVYG